MYSYMGVRAMRVVRLVAFRSYCSFTSPTAHIYCVYVLQFFRIS